MKRRIVAGLLFALACAHAAEDGPRLRVVVSVRAQKDLAAAAALRAAGVVCEAQGKNPAAVRALARLARERGMTFWLAARSVREAQTLAKLDADGVALLFDVPPARPPRSLDFAARLKLKRAGDRLGEEIRRLKTALAGKKLAVCAPLSAIDPETAQSVYVPVKDLMRDGTVDWACLRGAERYCFHRLRLLRDAALCAGLWADAAAAPASAHARLAARAALAAMQNPTCDAVWLTGFDAELARRGVEAAREAYERRRAEAAALEEAIRSGRLAIDQQVLPGKHPNQATVHGVAQSFTPSRDAACPLAEVFVAIRGEVDADLTVEIRGDADGRPGPSVLARATIPASAFAQEPTYRWGRAWFKPAPRLRKGRRYWLYLPSVASRRGAYVWRIITDGADARGRAWSRRYDYSKHAWVFRIYLSQEAGR